RPTDHLGQVRRNTEQVRFGRPDPHDPLLVAGAGERMHPASQVSEQTTPAEDVHGPGGGGQAQLLRCGPPAGALHGAVGPEVLADVVGYAEVDQTHVTALD